MADITEKVWVFLKGAFFMYFADFSVFIKIKTVNHR